MNLNELKEALNHLDRALETATHVRPYKADAHHYNALLKEVKTLHGKLNSRIAKLEPRISRTAFDRRPNGAVAVFAFYGDSTQPRLLFQYFPEELTFYSEELIGKTEREARELRAQRNREFIKEYC